MLFSTYKIDMRDVIKDFFSIIELKDGLILVHFGFWVNENFFVGFVWTKNFVEFGWSFEWT